MPELVLAIETSCDDTAAAVVRDGRHALSSVIAAQEIHREFGGVVPELASRAHLDVLGKTVTAALRHAEIGLDRVDAIAVTRGPGLMGCLLVGVAYAKALALSAGKPLIGVNHIEGHLWAPVLDGVEVPTPFVGAALSGGHSELLLVRSFGDYELCGSTRDDAAGEAFDKVGKLLGLGFPGGPVIDELAAKGNPSAIALPHAMMNSGDFDLSFSGLKTAARRVIEAQHPPFETAWLQDLCASFQAAAITPLAAKILRLAAHTGARAVVVGGGVACNSALRRALREGAEGLDIPVIFPSSRWCTDNAAMIGVVGSWMLDRGDTSGHDLEPVASLEETGFARRGAGTIP